MISARRRVAGHRSGLVVISLFIILVAGYALRLFGLDWDRAQYLHPDERHIVADVLVGRITLDWPPDVRTLLDPATSTLNPRPVDPESGENEGFAYGTLPLYATDVVAEGLTWITGTDWHAYGRVHYLGRALSIVLDTVSILLVFLIGRRVAGDGAALLAALFYALAPIAIQLAHFFTSESWITCFVALSLLAAIRGAEHGSLAHFALAGAAAGVAIASKSSVAVIAGPIALAVVWDAGRRLALGYPAIGVINAFLARATVAACGFIACLVIGEPYAVLDPRAYLSSLRLQIDIQSGRFDVPFTRQYIDTPRGWYQLEQLLRWGLGPATGLLALVGTALLILRFVRRRSASLGILLSWLLLYGLAVLVPESKFLRYLLPLIPLFSVAAGVLLVSLTVWLVRTRGRQTAMGALSIAILMTIGWSAAFASIYAVPHPRLEASSWILTNIPAGSTTSNEIWDDRLPLSVMPGLDGFSRRIDGVSVNLYRDFPSEGDAQQLVPALESVNSSAPVAAAVAHRDYQQAANLLRGPLRLELSALDGAPRTRLASELTRAAARMTTSPELQDATLRAADAMLRTGDDPAAGILELADALAALPQRTAEHYLYEALVETDYYVLSSNRVLTGVGQSPWRYPVQIRFYELLFAGELGFELVKEFTAYPRLGPLVFKDDNADESFINYDHPHVWIFAKHDLIERAAFAQLMAPAALKQTTPERQSAGGQDLMLDRPVGDLPLVDDARWSAALTSGSWWALLFWVGILLALQAAGWPLASVAFAGFPDRGWAAGRLLALLLAGWLVWFLASWQAIAFRAVWCAVAVTLVGAAGWFLRRWMHARGLPANRLTWRTLAAPEAIFWSVFSLFLLFRYLNPDSWHPFWGGEKPMEFAHLNAILRSAHFPPVDPWYAGGFINYYYYGTFLVAFAVKLTGIPSEIAFNLAQPTVIALLAAMAYSVAAALGRRLTGRNGTAIVGGLAAVLLVSFGGNMVAAARLLQATVGDLGRVDPWSYWVWDARQIIPFTINEFPYFTGLYADLHAHVVAWPITVLVIALAYALAWDRHGLLLAVSAPRRFSGTAGLVSTRLALLALALGSLAPTNAWDVATYAALSAVALLMATASLRSFRQRLGVLLGGVGIVSLITGAAFLPFFLHYVALYRSLGEVRAPTPFVALLSHFGGFMALLLVGLVLLTTRQAGAHRLNWLNGPITLMVLLALLLALWYAHDRNPAREDTVSLLLVGFVAVVLLASVVVTSPRRADFGLPRLIPVTLAVTSMAGIALSLAAGQPTMALYLAFGLAAALGWLAWRRPTERFMAAMIAGGMLLGAVLETLFLVDNLESIPFYRMNTIFKFYNQLWILFAVSAGALVALMVDKASTQRDSASLSPSVRTPREPDSPRLSLSIVPDRSSAAGWARGGMVLAIVVMLFALGYPLTATMPRLETRFADTLGSGTLNALDWMRYGTVQTVDGDVISFDDDRAVIDWFNSNVEGTPVIAEASFGAYRCNGSRISIATGLPAVVGWVNHESQQRPATDLFAREDALRTLYSSADVQEKRAIISRFDIEYIVVGELERHYPTLTNLGCRDDGSREGIAAFEEMVGTTLDVAFRSNDTIVYRVI